MVELPSILRAVEQLTALGEEAVLATVVRVDGSSYRRPGARMLVLPTMRQLGSVSGGCLEGDVARQAWQRTADGAVAILEYDSRAEDDGLWGLGLGCNGRIQILVERLVPGGNDACLALLRACAHQRETVALGTVIAAEGADGLRVGTRVARGTLGTTHDPHRLTAVADVQAALDARLAVGRSAIMTLPAGAGKIDLFVEVVHPPLRLRVFGGGHDARPLVAQANRVGWHVTVVDRRARFLTAEHFPEADALVHCPSADVGAHVDLAAGDYAVVMTHSYPDDLAILRGLLESPVHFIGLLGPRHRRERLLRDLADDGYEPPADRLSSLRGPVGLDVGAEGPEEVAVSVVAQILAERSYRGGGPLHLRDGPIHVDGPAVSTGHALPDVVRAGVPT